MLSESLKSHGENIDEAPCSSNYIIVIDDEYDIRQIMKYIISRYNCDCLLFENVLEFEKYSASQKNLDFIKMIIIDNQMPGVDGVEYCKINKERFKSIPKILITGDMISKESTEDFEGVLYKPFSLGEVTNLISSLTRIKKKDK